MIDVNGRLTERVSRARLKLEFRRAMGPLAVTLVGAGAALACSIWIISNVSQVALTSTRTVRFDVNDATAVVPDRDPVLFKGIVAGEVTGVSLINHQAVLTVELQTKFGPIYRNAQAALRPQTPLEDMYLDITDRGDPSAGLASATHPVPADQTATQVEVGTVLDMFQPDVRDHFRVLLANLGNGLADRGAYLRAAFVQLMPLLQAAGRLTDQLGERATLTRELVHNASELMTALGQHNQLLTQLVNQGGAAFSDVRQQSASLSAMLQELPPTLQQADASLVAVNGILPDVNTAVSRLLPVANKLPSALTSLRSLSADLGPAVQRLEPSVRGLLPLSRTLIPLSRPLSSAFTTLRPQMPVVTTTIKDLAACAPGISNFFLLQPTVGPFDDDRGPMLRADVQASASALGVVSTPGRVLAPGCAGGTTIGGRPATTGDMH